LSKRGKDTELDAGHGMEETLEFCFKEFAAAGYILELYAHALTEIYSSRYRAGIACY